MYWSFLFCVDLRGLTLRSSPRLQSGPAESASRSPSARGMLSPQQQNARQLSLSVVLDADASLLESLSSRLDAIERTQATMGVAASGGRSAISSADDRAPSKKKPTGDRIAIEDLGELEEIAIPTSLRKDRSSSTVLTRSRTRAESADPTLGSPGGGRGPTRLSAVEPRRRSTSTTFASAKAKGKRCVVADC